MRISDWSSDVCSSDLVALILWRGRIERHRLAHRGDRVLALAERLIAVGQAVIAVGLARISAREEAEHRDGVRRALVPYQTVAEQVEIGRASCREGVCTYG